jgi:hypothetical protein
MRRKLALLWSLLALSAGLAYRASAVITTIDAVPAATLLLPYFEVDLDKADGQTTLFSVNNASATAILAHVVVWSDLSVPVLDFNLYLTGYDVQTINLRDILAAGLLPQTASAGQDPSDTISPKGAFSQDINFASCAGLLPPPPLPPFFLDHLRSSLTGKASAILGNLCAGQNLGDNVARGYVTVDTVSNCTLRFPGDPGYFQPGGTGDATDQNVLWGDYFFLNPSQGFAEGETLVHVEASATAPETSVPGQYTFYGRYVGWTAADNREPLATGFEARYVNGGLFNGGTSFLVWRDSKTNQGPFTCPAAAGVRPSWYPLGQESIVIFDEEEHPLVPETFPVSPQPPGQSLVPFPAEAQRVRVGGSTFPVPFEFGWMDLDLNTTITGNPNPPVDPTAAQAWVVIVMQAGVGSPQVKDGSSQNKGYSVGFDATRADSASRPRHQVPKAPSATHTGTPP